MKKIAFFVQHMLCGGVENALLALATELKKKEYQVYIYVLVERGEFIEKARRDFSVQEIPMPENLRNSIAVGGIKLSVKKAIQDKDYIRTIKLICHHLLGKSDFAELKVNFSKIPMLNKEFDIVVNYHMHSPFLVKYLDEKVEAKRKFTWIHNDFNTTGYDITQLKKHLECNEYFLGVSQQVVNEFINILPEFKERSLVAYNIVPIEAINKKAKMFYPEEYYVDRIKLLSVGRLEKQKGYDITIEVARLLSERNIEFTWFILGEGSLRKNLEHLLKKYKLENKVHFLGAKANPYPYFSNCDIYVQTSYHEGYVTTVTEAKILCKPIVCTDVSGAREQLNNGENGEIADISVESVLEKIIVLINNKYIRNEYEMKLKNEDKCIDYEYLKIFKNI